EASIGFDQRAVLSLVAGALTTCLKASRIVLVVRLHPRGEAAPSLEKNSLRAVVDRTPDPRDASLAADLVGGMNSVLLLESCFLGQPVLSIQPGLRGPDTLPSNPYSISAAAYTAEDARSALQTLASDPSARDALAARTKDLPLMGGAAERVWQI